MIKTIAQQEFRTYFRTTLDIFGAKNVAHRVGIMREGQLVAIHKAAD